MLHGRHTGSQFPEQGSNPQWKCRVLTTEPLRTSCLVHFYLCISSFFFFFFFLINVAQLGFPPLLFCLVTFSFWAVLGLRSCARAFSSCDGQASPCGGFSCRGAWSPGLSGVEHRLSFSGVWTLPRRGIKHISSALEGGFLTAGPPGKSLYTFKWLVLAYKNFTSIF